MVPHAWPSAVSCATPNEKRATAVKYDVATDYGGLLSLVSGS